MTEQDEQDLRELQAELVADERSPWQPRCVSRVFGSASAGQSFVFTMQVWIDLDAVRSPFLLGELPDPDDDVLERFREAFAAFGHVAAEPEKLEGDELALLGHKILRAIREGFAMRVKLGPPPGSKLAEDPGLGEWLSMLRFLKAQMGFSLAEALALPVAQAFALIVSQRTFEGWSVQGESYSDRDDPPSPAEQDSGVTREVTHG